MQQTQGVVSAIFMRQKQIGKAVSRSKRCKKYVSRGLRSRAAEAIRVWEGRTPLNGRGIPWYASEMFMMQYLF